MKLIRKLVTGLMILLVALGSSPLEVFASVPDLNGTEWPTISNNGTASTLPLPPAPRNIVDLKQMFKYPILDYSKIPLDPSGGKILDFSKNKSYVTSDDSSVAVLTRDSTWQSGVMWSLDNYKVKLNEPFHMVSYIYLGDKGQTNKGADGITFTMHNDNKIAKEKESGSTSNTRDGAYGALGNGLGVYGNHFSGADTSNVYVKMKKGVTNGIALEFDTFYNDEKGLGGKQFTDTDLWQYIEMGIPNVKPTSIRQGTANTEYGHIAINYLNKMQDNRANGTGQTFDIVPKHEKMLSVGWDGEISGLHYQNGWQVSKLPSRSSRLADNLWHRLEVKWTPKTDSTGDLTYIIYRQGHIGNRNVSSIYDTSNDTESSNDILTYTISDLNVVDVFKVNSTADSVYWGFTGSTGGFQNNQAVQMLQLPVPYYKSGIRKEDQDKKLVKNAKFQLEVLNGGNWQPVKFHKAVGSETQDYVLTGVDNGLIGVTTDLVETSPTYGTVTATQLPKGTYRWVEIEAPEGYKIDTPTTDEFELKYNIENENESSKDFVVTNTKLSQIELYKKDKDTDNPLNGAKFTISKVLGGVTSYLKAKSDNSDFEWTMTEKEAKQFETGYSYFVRNGEIVEEDKKDGYIRIGYIESGANLSWEEVEVPKGYDSSGTLTKLTGDFTPSTTDNGYVYSATQINSRLYQVSLEKIASDTNAPLSEAEFSLEQYDGSVWKVVKVNKTTGEDGKITITPGEDGKITITTDEDGKITISNLKAGTYRWKEVTAPDGYQISQPDQNEFVVEVEYESALKDPDPDTNNYIFNPTIVENDREFELVLEKLEKLSSTFNRPIGEVEFTLYSNLNGTTFSDSDKISTLKTNSKGEIVFGNNLINADKTAEKTYYLVETKAAKGFIALNGYFKVVASKTEGIDVSYVSYKSDGETDERPFNFTRNADDKYSGHLTIYNKRESILPTTGGNGILGYVGIGLTMTIVALLFFIARKR
ncbi:SpaA isopeptide-forming pilin-related protein, partial [Jeotgalibaca porci]|uniref:SpaA isopeptide-forming pilin-related protein n=1 Tax=Jeotgalibaca porci TaxID=1868793 RepID=UPI00359FDE91